MTENAPTPELKRWYAARRKAAALVLTNPVYTPIFERVDREIYILENQQDTISRARAVVARHKAVA